MSESVHIRRDHFNGFICILQSIIANVNIHLIRFDHLILTEFSLCSDITNVILNTRQL